jgi:PhzF family phenazine biosynthesis protein
VVEQPVSALRKLPLWQIDAFSEHRFGGNPAAVVPLEAWLPDATLLAIAAENNLAETAYIVPEEGEFRIRWFTPTEEVPLCGHATLASAWVVLHRLEPARQRVVFRSLSGPLTVERAADRLVMDFPVNTLEPNAHNPALVAALGGHAPRELHSGWQWLAVYATEAEVRALKPDMAGIVATGIHGVICTAPGDDCDFVSRFFAPGAGVPEDHATGSSHTRLVPYWAAKLGKTRLFARQVSARGGQLWCELHVAAGRVSIAGQAALYLEGLIEI